MCSICVDVSGLNLKDAVALIGKAMTEDPSKKKHLNKLLDKLMDPEEQKEDPELAEEWELSRRGV
jgi:hypothetical protein